MKTAWLPIDSAPRDGRPVWVKGNNYGDPERGHHCGWAYWDTERHKWRESGTGDVATTLLYLTHWMPQSAELGKQ